jgi:hypothetical protein
MSIFNYRYRKVGGIRFLRIGRLQFSFCLCKAFEKQEKRTQPTLVLDDVKYYREYPGGSTVVVYRDR